MAARRRSAPWPRAGVTAVELDAIVLSTATPDRLLPSTAVRSPGAARRDRAAAFDIGAACTGWVYALTVAEGMIASGQIETVLVVGAEKMSAIVDWQDRSTCVLFGDGAGAVVLRAPRSRAGHPQHLPAQRRALAELLWRPGGGAADPVQRAVAASGPRT